MSSNGRLMGKLGTSSLNVDGVVAVAHTEGGGQDTPNNREFLLRSLAGFVVHSNTAAVLVVDYGSEVVNNQTLQDYMNANNEIR